MKKVKVQWTEFHNYEVEIEVPEGLTSNEEMNFVMSEYCYFPLSDPYEVNTDWDSFDVEDKE